MTNKPYTMGLDPCLNFKLNSPFKSDFNEYVDLPEFKKWNSGFSVLSVSPKTIKRNSVYVASSFTSFEHLIPMSNNDLCKALTLSFRLYTKDNFLVDFKVFR